MTISTSNIHVAYKPSIHYEYWRSWFYRNPVLANIIFTDSRRQVNPKTSHLSLNLTHTHAHTHLLAEFGGELELYIWTTICRLAHSHSPINSSLSLTVTHTCTHPPPGRVWRWAGTCEGPSCGRGGRSTASPADLCVCCLSERTAPSLSPSAWTCYTLHSMGREGNIIFWLH